MLSTDELLDLLASPNPHDRDEVAYGQLAERLSTGAEDGRLSEIGDRAAALLGHAEVQARSFGALVVAEVVARDVVCQEVPASGVHGWYDACCRWYLAEHDLRGWDPTLGWLHAIAHGADALGSLGRSPHTTSVRLAGLLDVARDRLLSSGDVLFANAEEDRLAFSMGLVLTRPELSSDAAISWLNPIRVVFAGGKPGPLPAWVANTCSTLRSLFVLTTRGLKSPDATGDRLEVPHGPAVLEALATTLGETFPSIG